MNLLPPIWSITDDSIETLTFHLPGAIHPCLLHQLVGSAEHVSSYNNLKSILTNYGKTLDLNYRHPANDLTPLMAALVNTRSLDVVKLLTQHKADVNAPHTHRSFLAYARQGSVCNYLPTTPLHYAALRSDTEIFDHLLFCDPIIADPILPLLCASSANLPSFKALERHAASAPTPLQLGSTTHANMYHVLVMSPQKQSVSTFLRYVHSNYPNHPSLDINTPYPANSMHPSTDFLSEGLLDPNNKQLTLIYPINIACRCGNVDNVKAAFECGAVIRPPTLPLPQAWKTFESVVRAFFESPQLDHLPVFKYLLEHQNLAKALQIDEVYQLSQNNNTNPSTNNNNNTNKKTTNKNSNSSSSGDNKNNNNNLLANWPQGFSTPPNICDLLASVIFPNIAKANLPLYTPLPSEKRIQIVDLTLKHISRVFPLIISVISPGQQCPSSHSALLYISTITQSIDIVQYVLQNQTIKASVNITNNKSPPLGHTPLPLIDSVLHSGCVLHDFSLPRLLLQHGAPLDSRDVDGFTFLIPLLSSRHPQATLFLEELFDSFPDAMAKLIKDETTVALSGKVDRTFFPTAFHQLNPQSAKLLLQRSPDIFSTIILGEFKCAQNIVAKSPPNPNQANERLNEYVHRWSIGSQIVHRETHHVPFESPTELHSARQHTFLLYLTQLRQNGCFAKGAHIVQIQFHHLIHERNFEFALLFLKHHPILWISSKIFTLPSGPELIALFLQSEPQFDINARFPIDPAVTSIPPPTSRQHTRSAWERAVFAGDLKIIRMFLNHSVQYQKSQQQ